MTAVVESFDPATGERLGELPATAPSDVAAIVAQVADAQPLWAALSLTDRGRYLQRVAQATLDHADALRDLIAREQGRPRTEVELDELLPSVDLLHWLADAGPRALAAERLPMAQLFLRPRRASAVYEPLGVIGVIGTWSSPWLVPLGQVGSALMAGDGVVLKPSSFTCLTGEWILRVLARAGVPDGLVRAVHGPGAGAALARAPGVAKVLFTGSPATGRAVGEACGRELRGAVLECGGHDAMLVLADADVDHAVAGATWAAFANAGQSHGAVKRAYVARDILERFVAGVTARARCLRLGDPRRPDVEVGPLASARRRGEVEALVGEALAGGARLRCGAAVGTSFYAPAVLTDVDQRMRIMREAAPGPVLCVSAVDSVDEALALANDSDQGLGASIWTRDRALGERLAGELRTGMVWINDHRASHGLGQCPWGGARASGVGRSHGAFGLHECVQVKLRTWSPSGLGDPWWPPYDETLSRAARQAATMIHGRESDRPRALRAGARPLLRVAGRMARDAARRG